MMKKILFLIFVTILILINYGCSSKSINKEEIKTYKSIIDLYKDKYDIGILNEVKITNHNYFREITILVKIDKMIHAKAVRDEFIKTSKWYCQYIKGSFNNDYLNKIVSCDIDNGTLFAASYKSYYHGKLVRFKVYAKEYDTYYLAKKSTGNALMDKAKSILNTKVIVNPIVKDESGLYDNSKIYKIQKSIIGINKINNDIYVYDTLKDMFKFGINIIPQSLIYNIEIPKSNYELDFRESGYTLTPEIIVKSYNTNIIYPNYTFSNNDISIKLDSIEVKNSDMIFTYTLMNNAINYVNIEAISFYVDDIILSSTKVPHMLPPKSVKENQEIKFDQSVSNNFELVKNKIKITNLTKVIAKSKSLKLGVSVKYIIKGKNRTLFSYKTFKLIDVINKLY